MSAEPGGRNRGERPEEGPGEERDAELHLDDGRVIIYDRKRHTAWIQSDVVFPLGVMR